MADGANDEKKKGLGKVVLLFGFERGTSVSRSKLICQIAKSKGAKGNRNRHGKYRVPIVGAGDAKNQVSVMELQGPTLVTNSTITTIGIPPRARRRTSRCTIDGSRGVSGWLGPKNACRACGVWRDRDG